MKYLRITILLSLLMSMAGVKAQESDEFKEIDNRSIFFQIAPKNEYSWSEGIDIPIEYINETLGTSDWVVYGMATLDENGNEREGNDKYSKNYTIPETPGFWLNSDGRNAGWGDSDAKFGITIGGYQSGKFNIVQYPNRCSIGEVLYTKVFFVNENNSEMVAFNVTCYVVSEVMNYEEVGAQDIVIPISLKKEYIIDFNLVPAAEALGVTVDELTAESNRYLKGMMAGAYSEGVNIQTGLGFDANGECNSQGDYYFWFENGKMHIGTNIDIPEDFSLPVRFAFNIGNKIYVYNATFVSISNYYLIGSIGTNKYSAYWHNLNSSVSGNKEIHANVTVPNTQNDDCAYMFDMLVTFDGGEVQITLDNAPSMFTDIAVTTFRFTTPSTSKGNATFDANSNGKWMVTGASGATYTLCVSADGTTIQTISGVPIVQLMGDSNNIVEYQNNTTALDILNYAGHLQLGSRETFTAYVEMVIESCYDLIVADNSQYFNVRFLRPVDMTTTDGVEFTDEGENHIVNVMDLITLTDWRDQSFTSLSAISDNGGTMVYDTPHYINYYEVEISADVDNAYTDVEGQNSSLTYADAPITWNGQKLVGGTLTYHSNVTTTTDFHIYVPITISYKWGTYQTLGVITVSPSDTVVEDITSQYIDNAGFNEDLTWQTDGSKKEIIDNSNVLSNRSIAGIAADNSVYALVNPATPNRRSDGRTMEATNGFIGQVQGWTLETNQTFPKCEWVYFGTIPYDLQDQVIPIADDGSTYLTVPSRPAVASGEDNVGFAYFRAGWGARAVYKQTVNLPKAKYRLEYWAININPNGKNSKNLSKVTCHNDVWEDETGLNDTEWTLHTILFEVEGETSIELGFESSGGSGSNPFLCIDGVTLLKIGDSEINEVVQFVDEGGNCKEDGSTINITEGIEDVFGDIQFPTGLFVENLSDEDIYVGLSFNVRSLPNGSFQIAFPVNCINYSRVGSGKTSEGLLAAGERRSLQAEWFPDVNGYGTCTVDLQINTYTYNSITNKYVLDKEGPTVTVNMIYTDGEIPHPSTNVLSATSPTILTGKDATLSIGLTNEDAMIAFEFDLQLPDGISIAKDDDDDFIATLGSRASKHTLTVSDKGNGLYHFLCYSGSNKTISGNEGELLSIELLCDENTAVGTHQATIKNIIFSDVDKNKITMADVAFDIEVIEAKPGDVNKDGDINVMDVVEMVAYIMGEGSEGFVFSAADLYTDGTINVMDLVNLVELIMSQSSAPARDWTDNSMLLRTQEDGSVSVSVNNAGQYVASEFIVEVGAGQLLEDVTADKRHRVTFSQIDDMHYKVMSYASDNSTFADSDAFMTLHVSGAGMIGVSEALLVDENHQGVTFAPAAGGYTTGIEPTPNPSLKGSERIYDLSGRKLETRSMELRTSPKGVYIVNGKKQVVK